MIHTRQAVLDTVIASDTVLGETQDGFRFGYAAINNLIRSVPNGGAVVPAPWYRGGFNPLGTVNIDPGNPTAKTYAVPFIAGRNCIVTAMGCVIANTDAGGNQGFFGVVTDNGGTPTGGILIGGSFGISIAFNVAGGTLVTSNLSVPAVCPPGLNWLIAATRKSGGSTLRLMTCQDPTQGGTTPPMMGFVAIGGDVQSGCLLYQSAIPPTVPGGIFNPGRTAANIVAGNGVLHKIGTVGIFFQTA